MIGAVGFLLASIVFKFSMDGYEAADRFMGVVYIVPAIAPGIILGLTATQLKQKKSIMILFAFAALFLPIIPHGLLILSPFFLLVIIVMIAFVPTNLLAIAVGVVVFLLIKMVIVTLKEIQK